MLRPLWWLQEQNVVSGGKVDIEVPHEIRGLADVLSVDDCPLIEPGFGRTVTATFHHAVASIIDEFIEGLDQPIGATPNHLFWSESLQNFIHERNIILHALLQMIEEFCGFSKDVMSIATDASSWNDLESSANAYTRDRLTGDILLASKSSGWIEVDYDAAREVLTIARRAKKLQCVGLLNSSLQARFCFMKSKTPFAGTLRDMLQKLLVFTKGLPGQVASDSDSETPKQIIDSWIEEYGTLNEPAESQTEYDYEYWKIEVAIPELSRIL